MADSGSDNVVELAEADLARQDLRRAKDRLRAVLRVFPNSKRALVLLGDVYYIHGDYRNALMHWSRGNRWDEQTRKACRRVFASTARALSRENPQAARYQLYAFAGSNPPTDLAEQLQAYQSAYFKLNEKRSRHSSLSCVPIAGGTMLAGLMIFSVLLGGSWSSLGWIGTFSLAATGIVFGVNLWLYLRASALFRRTVEGLYSLSQLSKRPEEGRGEGR